MLASSLLTACAEKEVVVPEVFRTKFYTSEGDFVVEAIREWSPRGVDRFHQLLRMGYFKESRFFRVVPDFIAQFGVHEKYETHRLWRTLFIMDDPPKQKNTRGTLAFAQSEKNTRATEIFINLADNKSLDEQGFTPFARVVEGMDIVDQLFSGYGELRPEGKQIDAGRVEEGANSYLIPRFPLMDYIKRTEILK